VKDIFNKIRLVYEDESNIDDYVIRDEIMIDLDVKLKKVIKNFIYGEK
jgi:hypothetical protein